MSALRNMFELRKNVVISRLFMFFMVFFTFLPCSTILIAQKSADLKYYDVKEAELPILGKGFELSGGYYTRLPEDIKGIVRKAVWDLGQNSSGVAVRFYSDSKAIGVKWELLNSFNMYHMTPAGVRGLDLYTLEEGDWLFVGTAQPYKIEGSDKVCRAMIRSKIELQEEKISRTSSNSVRDSLGGGNDSEYSKKGREYLLYLPLYDGVVNLEIGVDSSAYIGVPKNLELVPQKYIAAGGSDAQKYAGAIGRASDKPIVFYGTSVTQGGCASRPGMSYTSIIERDIHNETINLGFSGNGRMDRVMADKIATIDAKAYFIDCLANCTYKIIRDSAEYFLRKVAGANPDIPVYMVSNYAYPYQYIDKDFRYDLGAENSLWYAFYKKLKKEGYKNLHFVNVSGVKIKPEDLSAKNSDDNVAKKNAATDRALKHYGGRMESSAIGPDHEATVDGVHMTDLGFLRFARTLEKKCKLQ